MPERNEEEKDYGVEFHEKSDTRGSQLRNKKTGRFVPKPGGPKMEEHLQNYQHISRIAKPHTYTAFRNALQLMNNSKSDKVRLDAVKMILAYAWGNPPTMQLNINQNVDELSGITSSEIKMLLSRATESDEEEIDIEWEEEEEE